MGHFKGQFRGQKSLGPLEISWEMAHYVVCPKPKKNNIPNFQNQRCIGIFMSLYFFLRSNFFEFAYCYINSRTFLCDYCRKPREISQFDKKSAKVYPSLYSSTEQLQVALWSYMFLKLGLNNEKSTRTLPLQSFPLLSLPLQSLPLRTLHLVSLVSLIIKT